MRQYETKVEIGASVHWHTGGPGYRISAVHLYEPADVGTSVRLQVVMAGLLSPVLWALTGRTARSMSTRRQQRSRGVVSWARDDRAGAHVLGHRVRQDVTMGVDGAVLWS